MGVPGGEWVHWSGLRDARWGLEEREYGIKDTANALNSNERWPSVAYLTGVAHGEQWLGGT